MHNCQVCGMPIVVKSSFRPRLYCSDSCRDYNKYKNALESVLISLKPTKEASKILRGDMFRLSNIIGNGTVTNNKD